MKLNKRKCKQCNEVFQKLNPLQMVCGAWCASLYGKEQTKKKQEKKLKEINKDVKQRKKALYPKKHKALLQDQINLLARKIDERFFVTCIDCERSIIKDSHGAHRNNVGGNENIRFNLHNIHASTPYCNMYNTEHKPDYDKGLKSRYSDEYYNYVRFGLSQEYKTIQLNTSEIDEALRIVRKLNRDFDSMVFTHSRGARDILNNIIGIYK